MIEWYLFRALSKVMTYPRVPYTPADPYLVFEEMRSDGRDHWGRRVVFVDWLAGVFGERVGQRIWIHIRTSEPGWRGSRHEGPESQV